MLSVRWYLLFTAIDGLDYSQEWQCEMKEKTVSLPSGEEFLFVAAV